MITKIRQCTDRIYGKRLKNKRILQGQTMLQVFFETAVKNKTKQVGKLGLPLLQDYT